MHSLVRKMPQYAHAGGKGRGKLYLYDVNDPEARALAKAINVGHSFKSARKLWRIFFPVTYGLQDIPG
jgi:hypothetical protein